MGKSGSKSNIIFSIKGILKKKALLALSRHCKKKKNHPTILLVDIKNRKKNKMNNLLMKIRQRKVCTHNTNDLVIWAVFVSSFTAVYSVRSGYNYS